MNKIETYSNWCYIDRLGGRDLLDGELIELQWPDGGPTEIVRVNIDRPYQTYSDHGHVYEMPVAKAFVTAEHRGAPVKIYIAGMMAQRYPTK